MEKIIDIDCQFDLDVLRLQLGTELDYVSNILKKEERIE
jgi:hypothetical protein